MAKMISATDLAIATAIRANDLRIVERASRFGDTFFAIEDAVGVIEVAMSREALDARLAPLREAAR